MSSAPLLLLRAEHLVNLAKNAVRARFRDSIFKDPETSLGSLNKRRVLWIKFLYYVNGYQRYIITSSECDVCQCQFLSENQSFQLFQSPLHLQQAKTGSTYNASTSPGGNWLHFPEEREKQRCQFMLQLHELHVIYLLYIYYVCRYSWQISQYYLNGISLSHISNNILFAFKCLAIVFVWSVRTPKNNMSNFLDGLFYSTMWIIYFMQFTCQLFYKSKVGNTKLVLILRHWHYKTKIAQIETSIFFYWADSCFLVCQTNNGTSKRR